MRELFFAFNAYLQKGLGGGWDGWTKFCSVINSGTLIEKYPMTIIAGGMREWIGERVINQISGKLFEVVNRDYEHTEMVNRNDIEDDKYGLYGHLIQMMGFNASQIWGDLAIEALLGGESAVWIDALPFFSATRKYGDEATINNVTSDELSMDAYATARLTMLRYCGHSNRPIKVNPNLLICGPRNEGMAFDILKNARKLTAQVVGESTSAQVITGTVDNGYAGTADILIVQELDKEWFLADTSKPLRPVIVQKRKAPVLTRLDRENDDNVFFRKEFIYGTDARGEAFLSFPHLIYGAFPS